MPTELEKALQDTLQRALQISENSLDSLQKSMNGLAGNVVSLSNKVTRLEVELKASTERENRMTELCNSLATRLVEVQAEQETLHLTLERLSASLKEL